MQPRTCMNDGVSLDTWHASCTSCIWGTHTSRSHVSYSSPLLDFLKACAYSSNVSAIIQLLRSIAWLYTILDRAKTNSLYNTIHSVDLDLRIYICTVQLPCVSMHIQESRSGSTWWMSLRSSRNRVDEPCCLYTPPALRLSLEANAQSTCNASTARSLDNRAACGPRRCRAVH